MSARRRHNIYSPAIGGMDYGQCGTAGPWGQDYYHETFMEVLKAVIRGATVSIIPERDDGTMDAHVKEFFKISQKRWESRVRNRQLFDGIQVLIGDYPTPPRPAGMIDKPE